MNALTNTLKKAILTALGAAAIVLAGCASMDDDGGKVTLTGSQEVPPVTTSATGIADIKIGADKSVSGTITTTGIVGTAAHIHMGPPDKYGPVIVPMSKTADNVWSFAPGAKLTDEQYAAYKAGNLFVNVHSAANKAGEIRAQLKPPVEKKGGGGSMY